MKMNLHSDKLGYIHFNELLYACLHRIYNKEILN